MFDLNWSALGYTLLLVIFGFTALLLIAVVLIQKGRGGGLASAFGGGSGTATAFGSKTGDVLTWATSVIFGVFLLLAIVLNLIANHANAKSTPPSAAASSTSTESPTPGKGTNALPPVTGESTPAPLLPPAPSTAPSTQP
jgi:preprotein translocase subunit SecG